MPQTNDLSRSEIVHASSFPDEFSSLTSSSIGDEVFFSNPATPSMLKARYVARKNDFRYIGCFSLSSEGNVSVGANVAWSANADASSVLQALEAQHIPASFTEKDGTTWIVVAFSSLGEIDVSDGFVMDIGTCQCVFSSWSTDEGPADRKWMLAALAGFVGGSLLTSNKES